MKTLIKIRPGDGSTKILAQREYKRRHDKAWFPYDRNSRRPTATHRRGVPDQSATYGNLHCYDHMETRLNIARNIHWELCGELGEGEVAFFSAKRWDRRNRADLIESATPCHDAQVAGLYWNSNPLHLTVLAAMSEDYTTAPQHLQSLTSTGQIMGGTRLLC